MRKAGSRYQVKQFKGAFEEELHIVAANIGRRMSRLTTAVSNGRSVSSSIRKVAPSDRWLLQIRNEMAARWFWSAWRRGGGGASVSVKKWPIYLRAKPHVAAAPSPRNTSTLLVDHRRTGMHAITRTCAQKKLH